MNSQTEQRKLDHIRICTNENVRSDKTTLFECVQLSGSTPIENIDCSTVFLGKKLKYPLIISGMTGGVEEARQINKNLAQAAQRLGIGFGVGSQRAMLENPSLKSTYEVRDVAPDILLISNIGASQLSEYSPQQIEQAALDIGADAIAVHLNSVQEKIQPEGKPVKLDYSEKVKELCNSIHLPVILKETGMGISAKNARSFRNSGISAIDVGGAGGTSFAKVEIARGGNGIFKNLSFREIPTAQSILEVRSVLPKIPLIATGGVRSGSDIAKAIALGADVAGVACLLLQPAQESATAVLHSLIGLLNGLEVTMRAVGAKTVSDLKARQLLISGELSKWKKTA